MFVAARRSPRRAACKIDLTSQSHRCLRLSGNFQGSLRRGFHACLAGGEDVVADQIVLRRRQNPPHGLPDLLQILDHEMGGDVPRAEHTHCPTGIVRKWNGGARLDGAGQIVLMILRVFHAESPPTLAVAREPVRMAHEELFGHRLRDPLFRGENLFRQCGPLAER
jgi:hypothetical protein